VVCHCGQDLRSLWALVPHEYDEKRGVRLSSEEPLPFLREGGERSRRKEENPAQVEAEGDIKHLCHSQDLSN
jgi:hypothetical protein